MAEPREHPPQWPLRFLRWFCPDDLCEEIEGDLVQRFQREVKTHGERRAGRRFAWNVIRFFRPGIILRNSTSVDLTSFYMLANYFKVALRVMSHSKAYSTINIVGLALGITGATLLFLWVGREFTYDQFHAGKDRIYIAWNKMMVDGQWNCWSATPRILAPTLKEEYAGIETAISYAQYTDPFLFTVGETKVMKDVARFTDPEFLTLFSFPLIKGDPTSAMSDPNSIVLTESFARQLFGEREPFGETLTISAYGMSFPFTVTGILKDLPSNTDLDFDYLIPWQFAESQGEKNDNWYSNSVVTFVKVNEGTDIENLNGEIKDIKKKHTKGAVNQEVFLYPLTRNHLYSKFENGIPSGGRIETIRMLGILGVCLVAIACINFVNLSTARAQRRSKEVAVRKVSGAYRQSLVMQFLCESLVITFSAALISLLAVYLALPYFNTLVEQQLSLDLGNVTFWAVALGCIMIVGILAGGYPAFYLSSFRPAGILKGSRISVSGKATLRTLLVVLQFGFAVTLIVSSVVVRDQIGFAQDRETGYARNNLVYLPITGDLAKNYVAFRNDLSQSGAALSVTKTSSPITQRWSNSHAMSWEGKNPENKTLIERFYVDEDFVTTAGLTLLVGRDMDLDRYPSDSTAVILNETAVELMNFDDPVGQIVEDDGYQWHVVGVIKDFVLTSPYQKVEPMVLEGCKPPWASNTIHIKLNPANTTRENVATAAAIFAKYNPEYPFEYHFVDVEYAAKFASMEKTLTITTLFTSIAILIACLGLLGLSTYMAESRTKEIGIRKVMGGSAQSIARLLSMDSLKPIFISIVLFSPLAWFAMNWWLSSFAYRVSVSPWVFIAASFAILLMSLLTIGVQTIRAAGSNPVESLRSE